MVRDRGGSTLQWLLTRLVCLLLQVSPGAADGIANASFPPDREIAPKVLERLGAVAEDPALEGWQREFAAELAGLAPHRRAPLGPGVTPSESVLGPADGSWEEQLALRRFSHAAIYDPLRDRMVVFGGRDTGSPNSDVWALTLSGTPTWNRLAAGGTRPAPRSGHSAFYDPVRDRIVVFGGYDGVLLLNDVWELMLSGSPTWSQLTPPGTAPAARYYHTAIYDPVRDRMVVFGGYDGTYKNDVWALTLAGSPVWSQLSPSFTPPAGRYTHTAIYDPVRDRMVVFGGYDGVAVHNDVWALTLSGVPAWTELGPSGPSPPSARNAHTAIYDPVRDRMVVFGGFDTAPTNDVWSLTLSGSQTWSELTPGANPTARYVHTAIYDPLRDRMLVFGGQDGVFLYGDVPALALSGNPVWSVMTPGGIPPVARITHTAIYDPVRHRMVVFGGYDGVSRYNDLWALALAGSPAWSQITPGGTPPSARNVLAAIYDPVRDRMVVFGGYAGGVTLHNDVWGLALSGSPAWSQITTGGTPPSARNAHTAIYDPVRDRMLVFGGSDITPPYYRNDVWALTLSGSPVWNQLTPGGTPPSARNAHTAIYDPVRDRMLVFGGQDAASYFDDVWALALSGNPVWSRLTPAGTPIGARIYHTAIYDPARDRMVVFGGQYLSPLDDTWALTLSGAPAWSQLSPDGMPPRARHGHTAIFDPIRDQMIVFAGRDNLFRMKDVWALAWGAPVGVRGHEAPSERPALAPPRPNPFSGRATFDFELPRAADVRLEVYDLHGRRVMTVEDGKLGPGPHSRTWDGSDGAGTTQPEGIYFVRLSFPGARLQHKVVLIR